MERGARARGGPARACISNLARPLPGRKLRCHFHITKGIFLRVVVPFPTTSFQVFWQVHQSGHAFPPTDATHHPHHAHSCVGQSDK